MASILTLPVEIVLDILRYLDPQSTGEGVPLIGEDAIWRYLDYSGNWWDRPRFLPSNPSTDLLSDNETELDSSSIKPFSRASYGYGDLLAVRRLNRYFNEICLPFLYHHFTLSIREPPIASTPYVLDDDVAMEMIDRYGTHIRNVRILVDRHGANIPALRPLEQLRSNMSSLSICYANSPDTEPPSASIDFNASILRMLSSDSIESLGLYSRSTFNASTMTEMPAENALALLNNLLQDGTVIPRLLHLDLALDSIQEQHYDRLREQISSLVSLSIRGVLRQPTLGRIWDPSQHKRWFQNDRLTTLQLLHCSGAYALHIPRLVMLFPSLRRLFIAGCGSGGDPKPAPRPPGWSQARDADWRRQSKLDVIHLECMAEWEIIAIGSMHTKALIVTAMWGYHGNLPDAFVDEEIFPGLKTLRCEAHWMPPDATRGVPDDATGVNASRFAEKNIKLRDVCTKRAIKMEYDAQVLVFPGV